MSKNAMAGAVTLCGVGLCVIGGALVMQNGSQANADCVVIPFDSAIVTWAPPRPAKSVPSPNPPTTPPTQASDTFPKVDRDGPAVVLKLHGTVGCSFEDANFFTASDFKTALARAEKLKASVIVLDIKSGGGRVDTKEEIVREILSATARGQRVVALVRDAGSAAALIALACPEILVLPAARIGAAVSITTTDSGMMSLKKALEADPEIAAKFTSYANAMDLEAARANNRSTAISTAMKEMSAELWWSPTTGFSETEASDDSVCYDDKTHILTLTFSQVKETGLGVGVMRDEDVWGTLGYSAPPKKVDLSSSLKKTPLRVAALMKQVRNGNYAILFKKSKEFESLLNDP